MARIKAHCPTCGEADLRPADIELLLDAWSASYTFLCPSCSTWVRKPADERVLNLLRSIGVRERTADPSPPVTPGAPAFTRDDLLDFHELLQTEHWFEGLVALAGRP
jgi:hypothetical protein